MNFDPSSVATLDQQQEQLNQKLARSQAIREMLAKSQPYGWGAGLGEGLASMVAAWRQSQTEGQQRDANATRQKAVQDIGTDMSDPANQTPEGARAYAMRLMTSGDKTIGNVGQSLLEQQNMAPKLALENQQLKGEQQKYEQAGPQAALGGQTPSAYELLTKREQVPKFSVNPLNGQLYDTRSGKTVGGSGSGSNLDPKALDQLAEQFHTTGSLPPVGRGPSAALTIKQIVNRAAELHPDANLATNKASFKADEGSLVSQQKILDNAESWERTGKANLNVLLGVAQNLSDTGSPWINRPVRTFLEKGTGDPNFTAFKAAHATVVNEYAKILSGAQGSGSVTEGARHEAESMLPLDATWQQLSAAAKVLDTDAGNRIGSARQQVAQVKGRLGGGAAPAQAGPTLPQQAMPPTPAVERKTVGGKTYEKRPDGWYEVSGG